MEYFSVDLIEKEWDYYQMFFTTDYMAGMRSDASSTSHPLIRNVQKPSDIPYISTIIYQKGASVLRMFENTLGTDNFFGTLGAYLDEYKLTSQPSSTLIRELNKIKIPGGYLNTAKFIDSWTNQAGFPYLNLTKQADGSYNVIQNRFLANGDQDQSK